MKRKNFLKKHLSNQKYRMSDKHGLSEFLTACFRSLWNKKYICASMIFALSACPAYASHVVNGDTETYTDEGIIGSSYDHPERNIVFIWGSNPPDGAAIRNSTVSAGSITIGATSSQGNQWNNKGIISETPTVVKSNNGTITIETYDDGVFSEGLGGKGSINIDGFKELNITSSTGYGLVDNSGGFTVKGGSVNITSNERPAIGNSLWTGLRSKLGKGISIEAGDSIKLNSLSGSVFAGRGEKGIFEITLDSPSIDLTGTVVALDGDIAINSKTNTAGDVRISTTGKSSSDLKVNLVLGDLSKSAVVANGGKVKINSGGNQSYIKGDMKVSNGGNLTVNAAGDNFSASRFDTKSEGSLLTVRDNNSTADITVTGKTGKITGNMQAYYGGKILLTMAGEEDSLQGNADNSGTMTLSFSNQSSMTGDMTNGAKVYEDADKTTVTGTLKADFDQASVWKGNLTNNAGSAEIALKNGSTWNGDLKALAEAGGTVVDLRGGSTWKGKAEGNGDISLASSRWNLTADSTAGSVNPDAGSVVSLEGGASKLTTGKLGGSGGHFLMDLVYSSDTVDAYRDGTGSDFIIAHGGNGSTYTVDLTDGSSVNGMKSGSKLFFASTAPSTSAFEVGQGIQIQNYRKIYNKNLVVQKETDGTSSDYAGYDDWFLTPADIKDPGGNVVTPPAEPGGYTINPNGMVPGAAHNAAAAIWRDNDTLLKRLGKLRWSRNDDGVWGRYINRKVSLDGALGFDAYMNTLQLGYDRKLSASFGDFFLGGAIEHSRGTEKYDDGDGSVYMTDGALYGTFIGKSGDYVDLVAKAGKIFTHYSSDYGDGGDFENWGFSASAEYGHKFDLGWSMSLEPQVQLKYSYLWADDYTSDNGAKVYQDDVDSLVGRFGFVLAKEFGADTGAPKRVYAKASVLHEFLGDREETLYQDVAFRDKTDLAGTWYSVGLGTNISFAENFSFYADAERDFGTDLKAQYRIEGGLRFEF